MAPEDETYEINSCAKFIVTQNFNNINNNTINTQQQQEQQLTNHIQYSVVQNFPVDDERDDENAASDVDNDMNFNMTQVQSNGDDDDDDNNDDADFEANWSILDVKDQQGAKILVARDHTIWHTTPPEVIKTTPFHNNNNNNNENNTRPRLAQQFHAFSLLDIFKYFINDHMVEIIVQETNRKAAQVMLQKNTATQSHAKRRPSEWKPLSVNEFYAYLGLLITSGATHTNTYLHELWHTDNLPIYRATMPINRFQEIQRFIRFDNGLTRKSREHKDNAAAIREIWTLFNQNLAGAYQPGDVIALDTQLFPYRGQTECTNYDATKTANCGLKFWWACDAQTRFPLIGLFQDADEITSLPTHLTENERIALQLAKPYINTGCTIVGDSACTSVELCKQLLSSNLNYVGTLGKSVSAATYIPSIFCLSPKQGHHRSVHSSTFGFHDNKVALCSYVPNKHQTQVLLSTIHFTKNTNGPLHHPDAVEFHNKYKGTRMNIEEMLAKYTTKRRTQRWTLAFFYNMLDVAALATFIIHNQLSTTNMKDARRRTLLALGKELTRAFIEERIPFVKQPSVRVAIELVLGVPVPYRVNEEPILSIGTENTPLERGRKTLKGTCRLCRHQNKFHRRTRQACSMCMEPVCGQHSKQYWKCFKCLDAEMIAD